MGKIRGKCIEIGCYKMQASKGRKKYKTKCFWHSSGSEKSKKSMERWKRSQQRHKERAQKGIEWDKKVPKRTAKKQGTMEVFGTDGYRSSKQAMLRNL